MCVLNLDLLTEPVYSKAHLHWQRQRGDDLTERSGHKDHDHRLHRWAVGISGSSFTPKGNLNCFLRKEEHSCSVVPKWKSSEDFEGAQIAICKEADAWVYCSESARGETPSTVWFWCFQVNTTFVSTGRFQLYFCFIKQTLKYFSATSRCMNHLEMLFMRKLLLSLKRLNLSKRGNQRKITTLKL